MDQQEARRRVYADKFVIRAIEQICELRDFACSNTVADWMDSTEAEYWGTVEVKAELIRGALDEVRELLDK